MNLMAMPLCRPPETVTEHVRARWQGAYDELREVRCQAGGSCMQFYSDAHDLSVFPSLMVGACDMRRSAHAAAQEAMTMGIPASALPEVSRQDSLEELQAARTRLSGMIASFMSASI
jgi:hypothetical protein